MACQSQTFFVERVMQSSQCNNFEKEIMVVEDQSLLIQLTAKENIINSQVVNAQYDVERYHYIFVGAGRKPSAGYRYKLLDEQALLNERQIILPVVLVEPAPNVLTAQVITSPCILLRMEKNQLQKYEIQDLKLTLKGNVE